jgi:KaiC/GvpD/RAD55 family RecA-like ATPase/tetratricopeptide (TPR) repeat protein
MELVKKAEPYAAADRLESARVLVSRARVYFFGQNMIKLALEDQLAALRVFEEEYSLWDAALALLGAGGFHAMLGEPQKGIAESLRGIALFEELGDFRFQMEACWTAGIAFGIHCLLPNEGLGVLAKVMEIDEKTKMGDYQRLVYANVFSSRSYALLGNWEEALSHGLKALELSKKTDSLVAPAMAYSDLTQIYVTLGDLKHAEEYFEKLMALPPEVQMNPLVVVGLAKAAFFAGKGQWEELNLCFKELFEGLKASPGPGIELDAKSWFAWALERQGRVEEAKVQFEDVQRARREAEERVARVSLQASLMVRREVRVGEEVEMRLDLVNVSKKPGLLVKAEGVIPSEGFKVTALSPWFILQDDTIEMKNRQIGAFKVETVKLTLQAAKTGAFTLNPKVVYIDELGESRTCELDPITVTVKSALPSAHIAAGRISSGFAELDDLLLGGIPENYAVVLASPSCDERDSLIKRFLEAGAEAGETTFYVTVEAGNAKALAEEHPSDFYLLVCNPQADAMIQNLPNVFKLKGIESLTEIDIALTKAFRMLKPSAAGPKRICVEIVSDVLLQHHAVITRKWLSALLPNLKSKGFTVLAVINPHMHSQEEVQAILGLFDGEIRVAEKEGAKGLTKTLKILKLHDQNYLKDELTLG